MEIFINGKSADIVLDTEKNLGDVLSGIELWVSSSGNRIQGVSVNGKDLDSVTLPGEFGRGIQDIQKLGINVSSWKELAAEALGDLAGTCGLYADAAFDGRRQIAGEWGSSAAARFLASDIPEIHGLAERAFSGEGLTPSGLLAVTGERIREIADPGQEILNAGTLVTGIARRMEDLPLDIQTGKDQRAAETVQLFGSVGGKLFRIFFMLKAEGLPLDSLTIDNMPAPVFVEGFSTALKDLAEAYKNKDTVLAGDVAEYELAPRLINLYDALKETAGRLPQV